MSFAPAKINAALHVLGTRDDGYHILDSLVLFANIGDYLFLEEAAGWSLEIRGPFASRLREEKGENIILKAVDLFLKTFPWKGGARHIILEKHLPIASGLGGGSADAACLLRALAKEVPDIPFSALSALALKLGADVPVCLKSTPSRMGGIGEQITPLPDFSPLFGVLVNPGHPLSTSRVFGQRSGAFSDPIVFEKTFEDTLRLSHNALERPAIRLFPEISGVLDSLWIQKGCWLARMSGSGATCFGLFNTPEDAGQAVLRLSQAQPYWWIRQTIFHPGNSHA